MSHRAVFHEPHPEVERYRDAIRRIALAAPETCPWAAYRDPLVQDVLGLYRAVGGGTEAGAVPSRALPLDPPHVAWEGLQHYAHAVSAIRAHDMQQAHEERAQRRSEPRGRSTQRSVVRRSG